MSTTIDGSASVTINSGAVLGITSGTAVASTSGTSIDFTSIPSWVKRITVMLSGVSTNGTSGYIIQIGTSGGVEATGYLGATAIPVSGTTTNGGTATSGFSILSAPAAASVSHGSVTLYYVGSNLWVSSSALALSNTAAAIVGGGSKTLSGTLDRLRITTVGSPPTDTFDAGTINILYE